jgi:hypothetical protein
VSDAPAIDPTMSGTALILMGGMFPLMTDAQREGRACPWCNVEVTAETDYDLGERHLERVGDVIHPVACRPCTNQQAIKSHAHHCRTCTACTYGERCEDKLLLRRLALETRS